MEEVSEAASEYNMVCNCCHQDLPIEKFEFWRAIKAMHQGKTVWCIRCKKGLRGRQLANIERKIELHGSTKRLSKRLKRITDKIDKEKAGQSARSSKRRCVKLSAQPVWVSEQELAAIYRECVQRSRETGVEHHVDHIVPLQGKSVCGLHVPWNLQVITATDNLRKSNKVY